MSKRYPLIAHRSSLELVMLLRRASRSGAPAPVIVYRWPEQLSPAALRRSSRQSNARPAYPRRAGLPPRAAERHGARLLGLS